MYFEAYGLKLLHTINLLNTPFFKPESLYATIHLFFENARIGPIFQTKFWVNKCGYLDPILDDRSVAAASNLVDGAII